jgi:hypothetical protein
MESQSSPQSRRVLYIVLAIVVLLLIVGGGVVVGRQLGGSGSAAEEIVVPSPTVELIQPTVTPAVPAPKAATPPRAAVPGGSVDTPTGIGILPPVQLAGNRRYVLQISSGNGAVDFSGSYTRGSVDPRIAVDVMQQIKGKTPWEQEIAPPAPDSRTWTLGATASTVQLGRNLRIVILDIGPK